MSLSARFVWIDLEMTGLNPATDVILEAAAIVTGPDLEPLMEIERIVFQPEPVLEQMSRKVHEMHTANGLLDDVRTKGLDIRVVESQLLRAIGAHCGPGQGLLCGRSVHHDWKFLVRYMPRLEQHLHYLRVDVSTIGVLVDSWFPSVRYQHQPANHRALADIRAGLEEMRFYCRNAFKVDLKSLATRPPG